jgi:putative SOS response-associated peptidase YedK
MKRKGTMIVTPAKTICQFCACRFPLQVSQFILEEKEEDDHLNPENKDFEKLYKWITSPYPSGKMKVYPVSEAVNSPRNNNKDLLKEVKF